MTAPIETCNLPASTLDLLLDTSVQSFSVVKANRWADALIASGVDLPEIYDIYGLDDSEGHACAKLVRKVLADIGLLPASEMSRLALCRDIMVGAFLRDELAADAFERAARDVAIDLRRLISAEEFQAKGPLASEIQALYAISEVFDPDMIPGQPFPPVAWWASIGFDPENPKPWLLAWLKENGMADSEGKPVPAAWEQRG